MVLIQERLKIDPVGILVMPEHITACHPSVCKLFLNEGRYFDPEEDEEEEKSVVPWSFCPFWYYYTTFRPPKRCDLGR
jgi:hypothetical protein